MSIQISSISIKARIISLAAVLLTALVVTSFVGMSSLGKVGNELKNVNERHLVLLKSITLITEFQLEQAVEFERVVRYGMQYTVLEDSAAKVGFERSIESFKHLSDSINKELQAAENSSAQFASLSDDKYDQSQFQKLYEEVQTIHRHHDSYEDHVRQAIDLIRANKVMSSQSLINEIENEENKLQEEVNQLIHDIEAFVDYGAAHALETEKSGLSVLTVVLFTAIVFGLVYSLMIIRSILIPVNVISREVEAIKNGDLTYRFPVIGNDELSIASQSLNSALDKIHECMVEVQMAAQNMTAAAGQVSSASQSLSQGSSEQAASLEETSSSLEEMSASITQNAGNARDTEVIASEASAQAIEGGKAVQDTVEAMRQITSTVNLIEDIAYKTNLLALNAAIEAARAGEHGRGFAVVADEVRKLAERSQNSAQEITSLAESSVLVAERAGELISEIVPGITRTASLVQEIAASSDQQATGVRQITVAIGQLDQVSQEGASASEELASTAEEMTAQADQLSETLAFFRINGQLLQAKARFGQQNLQRSGERVVALNQQFANSSQGKSDDFERFNLG